MPGCPAGGAAVELADACTADTAEADPDGVLKGAGSPDTEGIPAREATPDCPGRAAVGEAFEAKGGRMVRGGPCGQGDTRNRRTCADHTRHEPGEPQPPATGRVRAAPSGLRFLQERLHVGRNTSLLGTNGGWASW